MCMSAIITVCNATSHNFIWVLWVDLSTPPPLGPGVKSRKTGRSQAIIQAPHSAQSAGEFTVGQDEEPPAQLI